MRVGAELLPEVFSTREVARAAGRPYRLVADLVRRGALASIDGEFLSGAQAAHAVARLAEPPPIGDVAPAPRALFEPASAASREATLPLAASGAVHLSLIGVVVLLPWLAGAHGATPVRTQAAEPVRLVFLATPGPGGGGGGGGLRQPAPPRKVMRRGERPLASPVPPPPEPAPEPAPEPEEVTPPPPEPPVNAPVASMPSDEETRSGALEDATGDASNGPGAEGGAGSGAGTGIGEGQGSGIGEGSGGGTGGGPFRPGSGITPPALVKEVRPDYPEAARRQRIEGDVVLEIVVRRDGTVGDVRVLSGLGHGLDEQAVRAVRQWRFRPAERRGQPVDVLVEVAVEFKLR
jgi:TonB family protein